MSLCFGVTSPSCWVIGTLPEGPVPVQGWLPLGKIQNGKLEEGEGRAACQVTEAHFSKFLQFNKKTFSTACLMLHRYIFYPLRVEN